MTNSEARKRAQAAASQVQGAAEVGADVEALAVLLESIEIATDEHGDGATLMEGPARRLAAELTSAGWVPPERVAEARAEELRAAANQLVADGPGVNAELRYDGTPDPGMSAYVEGLHDAWQMLTTRASALDGDQGGGLLDEDGGA